MAMPWPSTRIQAAQASLAVVADVVFDPLAPAELKTDP
jgi:hypothetical protein